MKKYVMVIDEGTTGTRALIYNKNFQIVAQSYTEFTQYTPSEDRVEHDAIEIYEKSIQMCKDVLSKSSITSEEIACIGITNQRATSVVWDKDTGEPLYNAIVWQDNRTAERCAEISNSEWGSKCKKATGWTVAPVYSSLMLEWMIKNVPLVKTKIEEGKALFGTIDTWLIWKLTGRKVHAISYSNASVTGSMNLNTLTWYEEFLDYLGVPVSIYPTITDDSDNYGETYRELFGVSIPITSSMADQHAALYAQGCKKEGMAKLTNGTGSFLDVNIGGKCSILEGGINTVVAWKIGDEIVYALEGYAAVTGSAVQWLRDGLGIINQSSDIESLAGSVENTNNLFFVPALTGLNAPFWDQFARGLLIGINRGTTKAHVCRATLEAIAYSIRDIINFITISTGKTITDISIDGGASNNNLLGQMLADILTSNIYRPQSIEATSLGAAQMAGLYIKFWKEEDFEKAMEYDATFHPIMDKETVDKQYKLWQKAVQRSKAWIE